MAEQARHLKDNRGMEFIMWSPDRSAHKRIGRGVRNLASAVWDRDKQNPVISGTYAKFTHNPEMKNHPLALATNLWPKPVLWTQCGALVPGRMIPGPTPDASGEKKIAR